MDPSNPLSSPSGDPPNMAEIREALDVLEGVQRSAIAETTAESAFIAGAAAALTWVLGGSPDTEVR